MQYVPSCSLVFCMILKFGISYFNAGNKASPRSMIRDRIGCWEEVASGDEFHWGRRMVIRGQRV